MVVSRSIFEDASAGGVRLDLRRNRNSMLRFNGPTESLLTPAKRTLELIAQSPDIISNWPEEHI